MGACQASKQQSPTKKKEKLEIQIPKSNNEEHNKQLLQNSKTSALSESRTSASKRQSVKSSPFQNVLEKDLNESPVKGLKNQQSIDSVKVDFNNFRSQKHKTTLKMNATLKTAAFSKFYSVQQAKVQGRVSIAKAGLLVQHNITGKLRYADIIQRNEDSEVLIQQLLKCQLSHPNIASIIEIFQDSNQYIIIKECAQGQPLSCYEPPEKHQIIIKQMIEAVSYLHKKNLIHGSLSLGAFERNGDVIRLLDLQSIFMRHNLINNEIEYLAPECLSDQNQYTKSRDIWALGMIAHNLMYGKYFKGNSSLEIQNQILDVKIKKHLKLEVQNKEFLEQFFHIVPDRRIALDEILKHNFLANNKQFKFYHIFENCQYIKKITVLQQCLLLLFINQFEEQQQLLFEIFQSFDQDNDGKIQKKDCIAIYPELQENFDNFFSSLPLMGQMDFQEFLVLAVNKSSLITPTNIETIFGLYSTMKKSIQLTTLTNLYNTRKEQIEEDFKQFDRPYLNFKNFEAQMLALLPDAKESD